MTETVFVPGGSKRGNEVLFRDNFKFVAQKLLKDGEMRWTCAKRHQFQCKAALKTRANKVIEAREDHSHEADNTEKIKCLLQASVKRKANDDLCTRPSKVSLMFSI